MIGYRDPIVESFIWTMVVAAAILIVSNIIRRK